MKARTILITAATAAGMFAADLNRGRDLYREGRYQDAARELRQVVQAEDGNAEAHRFLGLALLESGNTSEAARHLEKAHELQASGETRLAMARLAVAQKNWQQAEEHLREASGDDLRYVRGLVHLNRDRYEQAAEDFEAYLEAHPEHAYAHYYAGLAYNGAKRPDKMLSHFETFLRMKPDAPEARKVRAVVRTGR